MLTRDRRRGAVAGARASLILPCGGTPGVSPVGIYSKAGGSLTPTRTGTRYFRQGSLYVPLAGDLHAVEEDSDGTRYVSVHGAATSTLPYSAPAGQWYEREVTDAEAATDSPISAVKWAEVTETADNAAHGYKNIFDYYTTGAGAFCSVEWFVKAGARRYLEFVIWEGQYGATNHGAFVRLDTVAGAVLEAGHAGLTGFANYYDHVVRLIDTDVWSVRLIIKNLHANTISAPVPEVFCAATNDAYAGAEAFAGDDASIAYSVAGGSVVANATVPYYGPPIRTAGAPAGFLAETLAVTVTDYALPGSILGRVRTWDAAPTNKRIWSWHDASTDAVIELFCDSAGHVHLRVHDGTSETVDIEAAVAINDGAWHDIRAGWAANNCRLIVDGTVSTDTSCTMPTAGDLDASRFGGSEAGQQFDGEIAYLKPFPTRFAA